MIATSIPNGFTSTDSMSCPFKSNANARVVPQEGQGNPVAFLMIQTRNISFSDL
jgi:hypothetical protein